LTGYNLTLSRNIILTDFHDIEVLLLESPALDHVLNELGDAGRVRNVSATRGSVRAILYDIGRVLGALRLFSIRNSLSLRFDGLNFEKFVNEQTVKTTPEDIVAAIRGHQGGLPSPPSSEELLNAIRSIGG